MQPEELLLLLNTDQMGNLRPYTNRVTNGSVEYGMVSINEHSFIITPTISPNPINNSFNISFTLKECNYAKIEMINLLGENLKDIFDGYV